LRKTDFRLILTLKDCDRIEDGVVFTKKKRQSCLSSSNTQGGMRGQPWYDSIRGCELIMTVWFRGESLAKLHSLLRCGSYSLRFGALQPTDVRLYGSRRPAALERCEILGNAPELRKRNLGVT
jgi:hypothetical protein